MSVRAEYKTGPRGQIAEILRREKRFLTAAEIHRALERMHAKVSLSTVYRTLDHLQAKEEVTARKDAHGEASFMLCEPDHHHHHAICTSCGRVEDVDCTAVDRFAESLRAHNGFQLNAHSMEFFGVCKSCH
ncbi:MAG: transcriptional repressor [Candidatus Eremiobacteraeota bacterium]|nr:transcriptional repressor [Candidatus Eremiobacteraeota bacterium]